MVKTTISILTSLLFFISSPLIAQTVNYDDVAVIVNDSSAVSVSIGNYFAAARGIPASRVLHVQTSTQETIDSLQFEGLRAQIEAELMMGNLLDTVNYLVTTKGMPLRISRGGYCDSSIYASNGIARCTCVESELPLMLGPEAGKILKDGYAPNYYSFSDRHFDRDTFGIFLVTRLDGYTEAEVYDLIDRSGPEQQFSSQNGQVVADLSRIPSIVVSAFDSRVNLLIDNMVPTGVATYYDSDAYNWLPPRSNVVGYYGVHYQPDSLQVGHTWEPGALAYLIYNNPGWTFDSAGNQSGEYLLADLIREGATVAVGPVHPTYLSPSMPEFRLFPYYFDTFAVPRYSAAEAFFLASPNLSYQMLMIGDPKTSVVEDIPASVVPPSDNPLSVYPNPTSGSFVVAGNLPSGELELEVRNVLGQQVMQHSFRHTGRAFKAEIDLQGKAAGVYFLRMRHGSDFLVKKIVLEN